VDAPCGSVAGSVCWMRIVGSGAEVLTWSRDEGPEAASSGTSRSQTLGSNCMKEKYNNGTVVTLLLGISTPIIIHQVLA